MKINSKLTVDVVERAVLRGRIGASSSGFCVRCGAEYDCCEPDARKYRCEECGHPTVYGAEELLFHLAC